MSGSHGGPALATGVPAETRVPFIRADDVDPELFAELLEVVERVGRDAAFTLGAEVETFEAAFAELCGSEHAVGVSSGTAALELALRGLGIGPGDEVIVPAFGFIASAEAVALTGAVPRLVDVEPETGLITAEIAAAALGPDTRCVIPVHLFGRTVEMGPLLDLCRERGVFIVEDACQAHGADCSGRPVGSLGDAGAFSFYPTKNLGGWGDGGAVVTDDPELASRLRLLRSHGERPRHHHRLLAGTDRLHGLQAAILSVKLRRLAEWNERRRAVGGALREALAGGSLGLPAPSAPGGDHVFHLFVVTSERRKGLRAHLDAHGVANAVHYPTPIHLQPSFADLGLGRGDLPVAERLAAECCSLPVFPSIEPWQVAAIAEAVRDFERAVEI